MARKTRAGAELTRQQILDAARQVFHARGVSRTTLEQVAKAAGVTRGAVYWHFANKTELFFAMREQISLPLLDKGHSLILAEDLADPLDGIEQTILAVFQAILECDKVRQMFEIMFLRCEYVDDFAGVLGELNKPGLDFLAKAEIAYRRAEAKGTLRPGLDPIAMALDSWCFVRGLFHHLLASPEDGAWPARMPAMIRAHMDLRRQS
ncbi:MAG: TetR family transcriptional regulator [Thiobacillaceae bacterium]|nr:TetR family transcriptional regulator [Thiobacillaceae bacterium]